MKKHIGALAALGVALSLAAFVPAAEAAHFGGGPGGGFGNGHFGGTHMVRDYRGRHGGWHGGRGWRGGSHWRGGGGWYGWGPSIFLGAPYYSDGYYDYDYSDCYWRHGRRYCSY